MLLRESAALQKSERMAFCVQGDSDHQTAGVGDERNAAAEAGSSRAGSVSGSLSINTKPLVPSLKGSQMADYRGLYITQLPRARDISSMLPLPPPPKLDASTAHQPYSTADQIHRLGEHHYQHQRQHQSSTSASTCACTSTRKQAAGAAGAGAEGCKVAGLRTAAAGHDAGDGRLRRQP